MAILQENFSEKGEFELAKIRKPSVQASPGDRSGLVLPIKSRYSGSKSSLSSGNARSLKTAMKMPERDPDARAVEFNFKFRGFQAETFTGTTDLDVVSDGLIVRDRKNALAKIMVQLLSVEGNLNASGAIRAKAYLENMVLEDSRLHVQDEAAGAGAGPGAGTRIVRLMEAKALHMTKNKMIEIDYAKEPNGDQNVEAFIHSFILVGSVSYLLEIATFFVPDQDLTSKVKADDLPDIKDDTPDDDEADMSNRMTVYVKIDEPDIFLVENIADSNSDALMLNTELQFKYHAVPKDDNMSMMASLTNIRCHTCRFNPQFREETMAQILQPCTLSFSISQQGGHGMRVQCNMTDLCMNVSPRSMQIIQNSVQAFIDSMGTEDVSETAITDHDEDHSQLWVTKPYDASKLWFLKGDDAPEAVEAIDTLSNSTLTSAASGDEQAFININNLVIKVESGIGNNTIPLLLLESSVNCSFRDWSSKRMSMIGSINLEMAYYNSKLALWEPVVEPIVSQFKPDGSVVRKRWDMSVTLQQNASSDFGSALVSPSFDDVDGFVSPELMPPLMVLSLQSTQVMEITVTKSLLGVLNTLATSFSEASTSTKKDLPVAPFVIQNFLGKTITVHLENNKGFKYFKYGEKPGQSSLLDLPSGEEAQLILFKDRSKDKDDEGSSRYVSPLQEQTEQAEACLKLKVKGEKGYFEIPVQKADKRFFPFQFRGDEMGDHHGMVSEISVNNGCKSITLKSIVEIKNHYLRQVNVYSFDGKSSYKKLAAIEPDKSYSVPLEAVYAKPYEFYFQIDGDGETMSFEPYSWRNLVDKETYSQQIQCTNTKGRPEVYINIEGTKEEIFLERTGKLSSVVYTLDIRPLVVLKNCLPVTIHYCLGGEVVDDENQMSSIDPGQSGHLQGIRFGHTYLHMRIFEFRETDWSCSQLIEQELAELTTWRFYSIDIYANGSPAKVDLNINTVVSHGTNVLSIYSPFWMINKTGLHLTYRGQDPQNVIYHPKELEAVPMMFSYTKSGFLGKRKASVRIEESTWSDPFTLDTIEDAGKVNCKVSVLAVFCFSSC